MARVISVKQESFPIAGTFTISRGSKTQADVGRTVRIAGKVSGPKSAKKRLAVQRKVGSGKWRTIKKIRTTKKSRYSVAIKTSTAGRQYLRVVAPKSSKRRAGKSRARPLTGYRWIDLTTQSRTDTGTITTGPVVIAGRTYSRGFSFGGNGAFFSLNRACSSFRGVAGTEAGASTGTLIVYITDDPSAPPAAESIPLTATAGKSFSYTTKSRLFLAFGGDAVVGSPQLRCSINRLPAAPQV